MRAARLHLHAEHAVPVMTAPQNAVGGKGPWGGHDDVSRNDKGMVATSAEATPRADDPTTPAFA